MAVRWQAVTSAGNASAVAWPTHQANDIGILIIETANEAITSPASAGWTEFANSPQGTGTAGAAGAVRLTAFWKRAASGAESNVTISETVNHLCWTINTFRGCITSGNPVMAESGSVNAVSGTSKTIPGVTTTEDDCEVLYAATRDDDASAARFGSETNASLTGLTERQDSGTTGGNGGGTAVWTGIKTTAGSTGDLASVTSVATINGYFCVALKVSGGGGSPVTKTQSIFM
jgi:hypothetical protein